MRSYDWMAILLVVAIAGGTLLGPNRAAAATAAEINRDCESALKKLFGKSETARVCNLGGGVYTLRGE